MKKLLMLALLPLMVACADKAAKSDSNAGKDDKKAAAAQMDEAAMKTALEKLNLEGYNKSDITASATNSSVAFISKDANAKGVNTLVLVNVHPCLECGYNKEGLEQGYLWIEGPARKEVAEIDVDGKKAYYVYGRQHEKKPDGVTISMHTIHLLHNNGTNGTNIQVKAEQWPDTEADLDRISKEELLNAAKAALKQVAPLL